MKSLFLIGAACFLLLMVQGVSAEGEETYVPELNVLNSIDYYEGEQISISVKVLLGALVDEVASCVGNVTRDSDGEVVLDSIAVLFDESLGYHTYVWVPELTWWENVQQIWNPSIGMYTAHVSCEGGSLTQELQDTVQIKVVE